MILILSKHMQAIMIILQYSMCQTCRCPQCAKTAAMGSIAQSLCSDTNAIIIVEFIIIDYYK